MLEVSCRRQSAVHTELSAVSSKHPMLPDLAAWCSMDWSDCCAGLISTSVEEHGSSIRDTSAGWKALAEKIPAVLDKLPDLRAEMHPHQIDGLSWLVGLHDISFNGILADEMGALLTSCPTCMCAQKRFVIDVTWSHATPDRLQPALVLCGCSNVTTKSLAMVSVSAMEHASTSDVCRAMQCCKRANLE